MAGVRKTLRSHAGVTSTCPSGSLPARTHGAGSTEADSGVLGLLEAAGCDAAWGAHGDGVCHREMRKDSLLKERSLPVTSEGGEHSVLTGSPSSWPPSFLSVDEGFFGGNATVRFQGKKSLMSRRQAGVRPPPRPSRLLRAPAASELS